jgi:tetratricopeptide (TPR) repeat protein
MTRSTERPLRACLAILLLSAVGVAAAQPATIAPDCPDLTSLQTAPVVAREKSAAQIEADRLVAAAQAATRTMSGESLAKAISLYEQAIRIDPGNAEAYLRLAGAHRASQRYLSVPRKTAQARAWENLALGRELDPAKVDGLFLLVDQVFLANNDYDCAQRILDTALRLEPENPRVHYWMSELLSGIGQFDRAFEHSARALALADADPDTRFFVASNIGRQRYMAGQYDWVIAHYAQILQARPGYWLAHFYRSLAYGAKGEFDTALVEARLAMPDAPKGDAGGIGMLALAYAKAGQQDTARELLQELLDRDARGEHAVEYRIAAVYQVLGERDRALQWLNRQVDDRDSLFSWLLWMNHDPLWMSLRGDPRFKEIQRRAGWPSTP